MAFNNVPKVLTPGTTYIIQARAVTKTGYSDYGQPLAQMVL